MVDHTQKVGVINQGTTQHGILLEYEAGIGFQPSLQHSQELITFVVGHTKCHGASIHHNSIHLTEMGENSVKLVMGEGIGLISMRKTKNHIEGKKNTSGQSLVNPCLHMLHYVLPTLELTRA